MSLTDRLDPDHPRSLCPLIVGQVWAFVAFLPGLALLNTPKNRYLLFFTLGYALVRLATVVGLGLVLWAADRPLRRLPATYRSSVLLAAGMQPWRRAGDALGEEPARWRGYAPADYAESRGHASVAAPGRSREALGRSQKAPGRSQGDLGALSGGAWARFRKLPRAH